MAGRMLKTQVPRGSIVWMAPLPVSERIHSTRLNGEPWYILRLYEPYARTLGCEMRERPPIELLKTMGITVVDKGPYPADRNPQFANRWRRYNIIGCRYAEMGKTDIDQQGLVTDVMVRDHMKESKKITNSDVESLMPLYDELMPVLVDLVEEVIAPSEPEEEGWIFIG